MENRMDGRRGKAKRICLFNSHSHISIVLFENFISRPISYLGGNETGELYDSENLGQCVGGLNFHS